MSIGPQVTKVTAASTASRQLFVLKTSSKVRRHGIRKKIVVEGDKAAMEDVIRKSRIEKLDLDQEKAVLTFGMMSVVMLQLAPHAAL